MNAVFTLIFLVCAGYFLCFQPNSFLPTLMGGAEKAATLSLALLVIYSVWLGLTQLMEECGLNGKISRLLRPAVQKLFKVTDEKATEYITLNLSANMLGISGAATPFGVKAAEQLQTLPNPDYTHALLFVVNATSVQLLPTTVLALLSAYHAQNPSAVILPSLLASAAATVLGALGVILLYRKKHR